jgi:hypothetical protein
MESNNGNGPVPAEKGHISEADDVRANGDDSNASLEKTRGDGVADVPTTASFANVDEKKVLRKVRAASQTEYPRLSCTTS